MPCLDPINYPSLTPLQNEYLESIRDKLELNGCKLTNKQDIYLDDIYYGSLGYENEQAMIESVNKLYGFINYGLSGNSTWERQW